MPFNKKLFKEDVVETTKIIKESGKYWVPKFLFIPTLIFVPYYIGKFMGVFFKIKTLVS